MYLHYSICVMADSQDDWQLVSSCRAQRPSDNVMYEIHKSLLREDQRRLHGTCRLFSHFRIPAVEWDAANPDDERNLRLVCIGNQSISFEHSLYRYGQAEQFCPARTLLGVLAGCLTQLCI